MKSPFEIISVVGQEQSGVILPVYIGGVEGSAAFQEIGCRVVGETCRENGAFVVEVFGQVLKFREDVFFDLLGQVLGFLLDPAFVHDFLLPLVKVTLAVDEGIGALEVGILDKLLNLAVGVAQSLVVGQCIALSHLAEQLDVLLIVGASLVTQFVELALIDDFLSILTFEFGNACLVFLFGFGISFVFNLLLVLGQLLVGLHHDVDKH